MPTIIARRRRDLLLVLTAALLIPSAYGASCTTESGMTAEQRDGLVTAARTIAGQVQRGDVAGLRANTIPVVAADFSGIAATVESLQPLVQHATTTVTTLYALDASQDRPGSERTEFYCGLPGSLMTVSLTFTGLPPGRYALAVVHATGVAQPQQISLVLEATAANRWMLAGFFTRPMIAAGHEGTWYWLRAREYAQRKMDWDAWFYYQMAAQLLAPVDFLSSPNLEKLRHEAEQVRPQELPGPGRPMELTAAKVALTRMGPTGELGGLDLAVHYTPDETQLVQLRDPAQARAQVLGVMNGLLAEHPELRLAFHGIWVHADQGNASVFALELPMEQIAGASQNPAAH